jgi:rfaE bifunctional protein kinase chain/domain
MKRTTTPNLEKIVRDFRGLTIGVYGDLMLDELLRGEATRISPEAPVPVVLMRDGKDASGFPGGSGNVAANVAALGGKAVVFGAIGDDPAGRDLKSLLTKRGIDAHGLVEEPGRVTPRKLRIVAHQHQLVRVDFEQARPITARSSKLLARRFARSVGRLDALIVSDYLKGSVTEDLYGEISALARQRGIPVLVDPKPEQCQICRSATVATPNLQEAERMTVAGFGQARAREHDWSALCRELGCGALLITRGGEGMTLVESGGPPIDIPSLPRPVYDVTGAGDTVIAVMALALAAGASLRDAATLANHAGGCVVLKFGTAVLTPSELLAALNLR